MTGAATVKFASVVVNEILIAVEFSLCAQRMKLGWSAMRAGKLQV